MIRIKKYTGKTRPGLISSISVRSRLLLIVILMAFIGTPLMAQSTPEYDEISVYLKLPYLGVSEIDAIINDQDVYLPVTDLFNILKIKNTLSEDLNTVTGFFINPEAVYTIDRQNNQIIFNGRTWNLNEGDLVRTEMNLYLKSDWYGKVFGLDCRFSFRDLTVNIDTKLELPGIKELKQEEMRANLTRLKGEILVDTTIERSYPAFRFGMADWSVYAIEQPEGTSQARLNLSLGSVVAGGEATVALSYYTGDSFNEEQQHYLWRHVNNDRAFLRQVMAGKITTHATASIYDPVIGVQLTNTPTTFRRSFGTYTLTDKTEPGWTVELYVNNVLVDYVKADASGFFTFEVPLVYGNTMVKLKFYGPWGEERTREQSLTVPYNFIPHKELEYTVSAGMVEDSVWSRFSRADINYGATRYLTFGGGAEYLSSVSSGPLMPFFNASVRLPGNVLLSGEYTYGVRARGTLAYRFPSNIQIDLDYIHYDRDQKAISYNYLEERRASLSIPVRIKKFSAYTRLSYYQIVLPSTNYSTAEWLFAGTLFGVSTNLTTYGIFSGANDPSIYSTLSLGIRLPREFLIMPQAQYSYTENQFMTAKISLEKRIFEKGYLNFSMEKNFRYKIQTGEIGLRYDFSFAQGGMSARRTNEQSTYIQYARGSVINDRATRWIKPDNRTNVGRGGVSIIAFLDLNANGVRDDGEPKVEGLNIRSNSGKIERCEKDTTIHITGLEPYAKFYIEVDGNSFDNISWRLKKESYAVVTDPNMLKLIEIPVYVRGEVTGFVLLDENNSRNGLGRMIVNISDSADVVVGRALTETDGYFSYFGLTPGLYKAQIDTLQLKRLKMTAEPDSIIFRINANTEGDYIENIDFNIKRIITAADTTVVPEEVAVIPPPVEEVAVDTSYLVIHEVTRELVTISEDYFAVQFGAFQYRVNAERMKNNIEAVLNKPAEIIEEDGMWKVRITGFADREELEKYVPEIKSQGITEIWAITNRAVKRDWKTVTKEDSLAVVKETIVRKPVPVIISGTTIQLGALESLEESSAMAERLLNTTEQAVTIRKEEGFYKVRITGFADTTEVRNFIPVLQKNGFNDIVILTDKEAALVPMVPSVLIPPAKPIETPEPEEVSPEQPEIKEEVVTPPPVPRFVLHAGVYHTRSQAEKAKRKIEQKLNLPVEIIEEWDRYRVIITGFFTREETYPYYPELAGLGFSDIFVYEKPLIDR